MVKYGIEDPRLQHDPDSIQRVAEGQNLDIRKSLHQYESVLESQRLVIQDRRQSLLDGSSPCASELERLVSLTTIDDLWSEYLASNKELRDGIQWVALGFGNPFNEYLRQVHAGFDELHAAIDEEIPKRLEEAEVSGIDLTQRGATWTYLTTDQPFGNYFQRIARSLIRKMKGQ
jgi:preprotein translocase subunit SecA